MAADSRTNAGVDYISSHQKLHDFSIEGDRVLLMCSSGNLSITQSIIKLLKRDIKAQADITLHTLPDLYAVARYIGDKMRTIQDLDRPWLQKDGIDSTCNIILGGQIKGEESELYLIYSQGNFIQAAKETPFLQIGEAKYGKPILDRLLTYDTSIEDAAKSALLSIDSTMKSNISVGPPIDLVMYATNSLKIQNSLQLQLGDPYLIQIRKTWEKCLHDAFDTMPEINWRKPNQPIVLEEVIGT